MKDGLYRFMAGAQVIPDGYWEPNGIFMVRGVSALPTIRRV